MNGRLLLVLSASILALVLIFGGSAAGAEPPGEEINRTYGGNGTDGVNDMIRTADGNYLLVGFDDGYPGDGFAMKITPNGTQVWKRTYGGTQNDTFWGVI